MCSGSLFQGRKMQAERKEDMSPDGRLVLIQQRDGDVIVIVHPASDSEEGRRLPFSKAALEQHELIPFKG
jgi:hypothetical protein